MILFLLDLCRELFYIACYRYAVKQDIIQYNYNCESYIVKEMKKVLFCIP